MALADHVHVARRFQRAIRIDTDLTSPSALEGFICPRSSADVLETMARHVAETGQGAFTWTGPYGSGKSSLAVALSALLNGSAGPRRYAGSILGGGTATAVWDALPPRTKGWRILPVVGRRDSAAQVVGEAIAVAGFQNGKTPRTWSEKRALETLQQLAKEQPRAGGGLVVFIDEMGKFLEAAAYDGIDIYFFQQLAEIASRSAGRLIVIGILHQAFEEYAHRLSREARDEWSKIQGRFVDLAINVSGNEQIDLLGRAIESDQGSTKPSPLAEGVASLVSTQASPDLPQMLEDCWPLHPVVGCLLGPMSRRRFGQNQRSIFGFLNSTEPRGFQDFLRHSGDGELYTADLFWDYLRVNLEPSIMASPDGHRWALAIDALDRCEAGGGDELQLRLLKTIGLVDLLKDRSGLVASPELLNHALPDHGPGELKRALAKLQKRSLIVFRKFTDSYSVFEGSDFDIDRAVDLALETIDEVDYGRLNALAAAQPVVAKRHYHETGALRWFDVTVVPLTGLEDAAASYRSRQGALGAFFLTIPEHGEDEATAQGMCRHVADQARDWDVVVGLPKEAWDISWLAKELLALEKVRDETPDLQGDRVARNEVDARIADTQGRIESGLNRAFDNAVWYRKDKEPNLLSHSELNSLASDLADGRFRSAPRLSNELLNRIKPSSNAVAAQKALLRRMALNEGQVRLGIDGFPPEGGLFESLLKATGLYRETAHGWRFVAPTPDDDPCLLAPAWAAATEYLRENENRTVSVADIFDIWRQAPFGIKDGLLPLLVVAFILSRHSDLAFYRQGIFQARMSDLDMDYLVKDPDDIQVRWMDLSDWLRRLLSDMAGIVRELDEGNKLADLEPIDVAKGLVAIYDQVPPWVERTQRLSANAKRVRQLFKQANDPNKLLFDDIPHVLSDGVVASDGETLDRIAALLRDGLTELREAYSSMLHRLREILLAELQVPNASPLMLAELRARAENIRQLGGDHRLEAFVVRLAQFQGGDEDMESLASMATNKPSRSWVDTDVDRASVELADLAQQFNRAEAFAHVKGRSDKRHAMAVVVGMGSRAEPVHDEFDITDVERGRVDDLVSTVDEALARNGERQRNVILAALAELSARYMQERSTGPKPAESRRKRTAS